MTYRERVLFYRDLGMFSRSGLSLERGLDTMKKGKQGPLYWMMDGIQDHIMRGGSLWEGMRLYPKYFDEFQVMIIKAAEESGKFVETCQGLSRYFEVRQKERRRLLAGMVYPVVLLHAVILLPPLKYLVVAGSGPGYWSVVLPPLLIVYGLVMAGYLLWRWQRFSETLRDIWDEMLVRLPLMGKLTRGFALSRVLRALSHLLNAGVDVVYAVRQAAMTAGNRSICFRLTGAIPVLENGGTLTGFFSFSGILSPSQQSVIEVAEQTGTLVESLEKMVEQVEEETSRRFTQTVRHVSIVAYLIAAFIAAMAIIGFYGGYFKIG